MIEIQDAPDIAACSSCMSPLVWLYSYRTGVTFSVVATSPTGFELHTCRHAQDERTWRRLLHGDPPSVEYVEAKNKITGGSHLRKEEQR